MPFFGVDGPMSTLIAPYLLSFVLTGKASTEEYYKSDKYLLLTRFKIYLPRSQRFQRQVIFDVLIVFALLLFLSVSTAEEHAEKDRRANSDRYAHNRGDQVIVKGFRGYWLTARC